VRVTDILLSTFGGALGGIRLLPVMEGFDPGLLDGIVQKLVHRGWVLIGLVLDDYLAVLRGLELGPATRALCLVRVHHGPALWAQVLHLLRPIELHAAGIAVLLTLLEGGPAFGTDILKGVTVLPTDRGHLVSTSQANPIECVGV
jgi:hypothetical protein